jgi:inhibitor of KinA sporulation pathway (predicted exonuclease)
MWYNEGVTDIELRWPMVFIVYDLEMTVVHKKSQMPEIIELGAVKVADNKGKRDIVDTFQTFVKPARTPVLSKDTIAFTGISQDDVDAAEPFGEVVERFVAWIGTNDYYLISWGPDDKIQLVRECHSNGVRTDWIVNHNNLQKLFAGIVKQDKHQQIGLKAALEMMEIPFSGSHHRALDDAMNTARLFLKLGDRVRLQKNRLSDEQTYQTEIVYKTSQFTNTPFADLAKLLGQEKEPTTA